MIRGYIGTVGGLYDQGIHWYSRGGYVIRGYIGTVAVSLDCMLSIKPSVLNITSAHSNFSNSSHCRNAAKPNRDTANNLTSD